jgi:hypothetical protein|nr:MAG TPA: hypothetical protein [Caudoviricetes sp.]
MKTITINTTIFDETYTLIFDGKEYTLPIKIEDKDIDNLRKTLAGGKIELNEQETLDFLFEIAPNSKEIFDTLGETSFMRAIYQILPDILKAIESAIQ